MVKKRRGRQINRWKDIIKLCKKMYIGLIFLSVQKNNIIHYRRIGYGLNVTRQSACLVYYFVSFFNASRFVVHQIK